MNNNKQEEKKTKKNKSNFCHMETKITLFQYCALSYIIRKRHHIREEEIQYLSLKKQS